jgi:hypothetical protein
MKYLVPFLLLKQRILFDVQRMKFKLGMNSDEYVQILDKPARSAGGSPPPRMLPAPSTVGPIMVCSAILVGIGRFKNPLSANLMVDEPPYFEAYQHVKAGLVRGSIKSAAEYFRTNGCGDVRLPATL